MRFVKSLRLAAVNFQQKDASREVRFVRQDKPAFDIQENSSANIFKPVSGEIPLSVIREMKCSSRCVRFVRFDIPWFDI